MNDSYNQIKASPIGHKSAASMTNALPMPPHEEVFHAVIGMTSAVESVEALLSRLTTSVHHVLGTKVVREQENVPSYVEVMKVAPELIRNQTARITELIAEIESHIFG